MTKFEQVGVNYQYDAMTIAEANRSFKYSCDCCCNKGVQISCDKCAIAQAHSLIVSIFAEKDGV